MIHEENSTLKNRPSSEKRERKKQDQDSDPYAGQEAGLLKKSEKYISPSAFLGAAMLQIKA